MDLKIQFKIVSSQKEAFGGGGGGVGEVWDKAWAWGSKELCLKKLLL